VEMKRAWRCAAGDNRKEVANQSLAAVQVENGQYFRQLAVDLPGRPRAVSGHQQVVAWFEGAGGR